MANKPVPVDMDAAGQALFDHIRGEAESNMPEPVQIDIVDGSMQFVAGWGWGRVNDRLVRVILFGPYDLRLASSTAPVAIWALPPGADHPSLPYFMLGVSWNGIEGGRVPRIYGIVDDTLNYV